jgi:7,8-dihydropterin-6-yl-methyl-4-(beta-D-ribofuranosyl)aminobenzene 5'-phosphate synthase
MDVGMTPSRLSHNMKAMNVSEKDFDVLFITHLHPDHIGGTEAWWSNTLLASEPPLNLAGKSVLLPGEVTNVELDKQVVTKPAKIAEGIATLGTIAFPELFPLSLRSPRNAEQVLAVNVEGKGIVIITGCGHPTIERIVARAQAALDEPIVGVVGGLHYEGMTREQAQPHIEFIAALDPQLVALSPHDSSAAALDAFREAFQNVYREIRVGEPIRFEEPVAGNIPR